MARHGRRAAGARRGRDVACHPAFRLTRATATGAPSCAAGRRAGRGVAGRTACARPARPVASRGGLPGRAAEKPRPRRVIATAGAGESEGDAVQGRGEERSRREGWRYVRLLALVGEEDADPELRREDAPRRGPASSPRCLQALLFRWHPGARTSEAGARWPKLARESLFKRGKQGPARRRPDGPRPRARPPQARERPGDAPGAVVVVWLRSRAGPASLKPAGGGRRAVAGTWRFRLSSLLIEIHSRGDSQSHQYCDGD